MANYWLGFHQYEVYSVDLAYNLSDSAFVGEAAKPLPQVVQEMAPTHIIVLYGLLTSYQMPQKLPGDDVVQFWQLLDRTIQINCPDIVLRLEDEVYGVVHVYHCHWPTTCTD